MKPFLTVTFFTIPTLFIWMLASYGFEHLIGGGPFFGAICGIIMVIGYYCFYKTVIGIRKERGETQL